MGVMAPRCGEKKRIDHMPGPGRPVGLVPKRGNKAVKKRRRKGKPKGRGTTQDQWGNGWGATESQTGVYEPAGTAPSHRYY